MDGAGAGYSEWLVGKKISKLSSLFVLPLCIVHSLYLIRSGVCLVGVRVEEIGSGYSEWLVGKMISLASFLLVMHFFLVLSLYLIKLGVCLVGVRVWYSEWLVTLMLGFISSCYAFVLCSLHLYD